ncbi:hypothetical protein ACF0H5_005506 [Mactra antiquata]
MAKPLKVCVCGGGKSAHVMAALAAGNSDAEVNVLTLYKDEAKTWSKAIEKGKMLVTFKGDKPFEVKSKPNIISKDPKEVVPESDVVIFAVTAQAHEEYLQAISKHLHKKMVIVGLPGLPGFEYLCKNNFGELTDQITVMSFDISPWISTVVEYGKSVEVTRTAKSIKGSILRGKAIPRKPALMSLQTMLGHDPALLQVRHFSELLFTTYTFFNPVIMYCKWKDWDGKVVDSEPLFYDIDEDTATMLENCSKEYQNVAHAITAKKPSVDLTEIPDIFNWVVEFYKSEIEDGSSLLSAITTNKVYKDVKHIMTKARRSFNPDFQCRYLTDDIPNGMVVVRGVAEIVGIETPNCDTVITWGQEKLKKKYLVDGKLTGPDVKETRAPQRFGFSSVDELLNGRKDDS